MVLSTPFLSHNRIGTEYVVREKTVESAGGRVGLGVNFYRSRVRESPARGIPESALQRMGRTIPFLRSYDK